ncbi:glycoside hydrolase family 99-like domain-containing protein [Neobacillus sp. OS1-33]|uniref:glycosyltransferase WbsX family protein n=1 Tax=Neobacillus sp. OS1-33 TaxID=3070683 RepID=UPI0027E09D35|nr:glycoside hydrolase family 99-like domain-containing protein [Neobacillus sp. OS1-33]WML24559.1 glycoside hydrolase family 99-like domain-containing protein [Neobacillus sp. OS1-33]
MKAIAFYLPQFHRIPENDKWWGEGFTEWTNTRKTKSLFSGHHQPRDPLNNYYYDLSNPEARRWQAELAKKYGIHGFCYYHYWFKGKRLLEKPFNEVLNSGEPDLPFCLSWANEPWTRAWDGGERQVLMPQDYGDEKDWLEHFNYLIHSFKDERYIKVNNKPLFVIYRPASIPRCGEMLKYWNNKAQEHGLSGIHFIEMLTSFEKSNVQEFDAYIEFEPMHTIRHHFPLWFLAVRKIRKEIRSYFSKLRIDKNLFLDNIMTYDLIWKRILNRKLDRLTYPGAFVGWDNSPRRGQNGLMVKGSTPEKFGYYLEEQIKRSISSNNQEFLFINAWNEWAEGTYLEPDTKFGYRYLEEVKRIVEKYK